MPRSREYSRVLELRRQRLALHVVRVDGQGNGQRSALGTGFREVLGNGNFSHSLRSLIWTSRVVVERPSSVRYESPVHK
jgi:hypothetical protein